MLAIGLVMTIGFTIYDWSQARQDARIEPRQASAFAIIDETTNGKHPSASYWFKYQGKEYRGRESSPSSGYPGAEVVVFFDPHDPSKNSLTEYGRKLAIDRSMVKGCGYASCGLAVALVITLFVKFQI